MEISKELETIKNEYIGKKITILSTQCGGSHYWLTLQDIKEDKDYIYFIGKLYRNRKVKTLEMWKKLPIAIFKDFLHFYYSSFGEGDFIRYCYSDFFKNNKNLLYENKQAKGIEYKNYAILEDDDNKYMVELCSFLKWFDTIEEAKHFIDNETKEQ